MLLGSLIGARLFMIPAGALPPRRGAPNERCEPWSSPRPCICPSEAASTDRASKAVVLTMPCSTIKARKRRPQPTSF